MKKTMSLVLALTLCLGLSAPALAAEDYTSISIRYDDNTRIIFQEARLEDRMVSIHFEPGFADPEPMTYILVKPGSAITLADHSGNPIASVEYWPKDGCISEETEAGIDINPVLPWVANQNFIENEYDYADGGGDAAMHEQYQALSAPYTITASTKLEDIIAEISHRYTAYHNKQAQGQLAMRFYIMENDEWKYYFATVDPNGPAASAEPAPIQPATPAEPTPAQPAAPVAEVPADAITYTVQKYDTMGQIALNYYGSYACHKALTGANAAAFQSSKGALTPGMTLILPAALGSAPRLPAPAAGQGESLYTVQPGDTLGAIAARTYGNAAAYKAIFERNTDRLKDANTIYAGQVIVLPAK